MKRLSGSLARSALFNGARALLERNERDWNLPLTRAQKMQVGLYMILRDCAAGRFPPRFDDEQKTRQAEQDYYRTLSSRGQTEAALFRAEMGKPFWHGRAGAKYLECHADVIRHLDRRAIRPPARLLEAGAGLGWMAEFLAASGFRVLATTLDPSAGPAIERRRRSLEAKGLPDTLSFRAASMERIDEAMREEAPFDALYVFEALHHAHDWRKAVQSFHHCLVPGGWCFILNEPNILHTFISYRVGVLSNTHEIGLSRRALRAALKAVGFRRIDILKNRIHFGIRPIWIAAQK